MENRQNLHIHPLTDCSEKFKCNLCQKQFENVSHLKCEECKLNLCKSCEKSAKDYSISPIQKALHYAYNHPLNEYMSEIQNFSQELENSETLNKLEQIVDRAHQRFYMFEEQKELPDYKIKATRFFTGKNGAPMVFFGSMQSKKVQKDIRKSLNKYMDDHWYVLKTCKYASDLRLLLDRKEYGFVDKLEYRGRNYLSFIGGTMSLGTGFYLEKKIYDYKFQMSMSGARFFNCITDSSSSSLLGCECELDENNNLRQSHQQELSYTVLDHNLDIDWGSIDSLPRILSVLIEIEKQYQNLINKDHQELNILFSAADYIYENIKDMKNNPLFKNPTDQRSISIIEYSAGILQIYLRLKPEPFTFLDTTFPSVYQTDELGDGMKHSFLTQEQFENILKPLITYLCVNLEKKNSGSKVDIDPQNIEPTLNFIDKLISSQESKMAKFIGEVADKYVENVKILGGIAKEYVSNAELIKSDFKSISSFVSLESNAKDQLNLISLFDKKHVEKIEDMIKVISEVIVPIIHSEDLAKMKSELKELLHFKELTFLAGEIERRKKDHNTKFHVDLGIESNVECISKYHIHMII